MNRKRARATQLTISTADDPFGSWLAKAAKLLGKVHHPANGLRQGSGLIRDGLLTSANIQDISMAAALIPAEAGTIYADRG